ncbi:hypothetical protein V1264_023764 [Littorina saxatilis]|uniref:Uncharacterized protein n=1 Tax=Littorina saxatilis TaxID=31220 RepID=A0AAN9BAA4_9CAEN
MLFIEPPWVSRNRFKMRILILLSLLCMAVWRVDGSDGCTNYGMLTKFERIFTPACNAHDDCYSRSGTSRRTCDQRFHSNLLSACRSNYSGLTRWQCEIYANAYRAGVRTFGWLYYRSG